MGISLKTETRCHNLSFFGRQDFQKRDFRKTRNCGSAFQFLGKCPYPIGAPRALRRSLSVGLRHRINVPSRTDCSKACARADWAQRKLDCNTFRRAYDEALAAHDGRGGDARKKDLRRKARDLVDWLKGVPRGLFNEIGLHLALKHRRDAPSFYVSTPRSDGDGSGIRVEMIPRSVWEEEPRCDGYREILRLGFDAPSFSPNEHRLHIITLAIHHEGKPGNSTITKCKFRGATVRGAAIVDAVTKATRAEDLADAFHWVAESVPSDSVQSTLQSITKQPSDFDIWQHHDAKVHTRTDSIHQQRTRNPHNVCTVS